MLSFRAIEEEDGWLCRHGSHVFDVHGTLEEAVEHMKGLASDDPPSQVWVHRLTAAPEIVATFEE